MDAAVSISRSRNDVRADYANRIDDSSSTRLGIAWARSWLEAALSDPDRRLSVVSGVVNDAARLRCRRPQPRRFLRASGRSASSPGVAAGPEPCLRPAPAAPAARQGRRRRIRRMRDRAAPAPRGARTAGTPAALHECVACNSAGNGVIWNEFFAFPESRMRLMFFSIPILLMGSARAAVLPDVFHIAANITAPVSDVRPAEDGVAVVWRIVSYDPAAARIAEAQTPLAGEGAAPSVYAAQEREEIRPPLRRGPRILRRAPRGKPPAESRAACEIHGLGPEGGGETRSAAAVRWAWSGLLHAIAAEDRRTIVCAVAFDGGAAIRLAIGYATVELNRGAQPSLTLPVGAPSR